MEKRKVPDKIVADNKDRSIKKNHGKDEDLLRITPYELAFENAETGKLAKELIVANNQLVLQNIEKEKRAAELVIANKELIFQNKEKEKRAAELVIANKELLFQNEEKEKRRLELIEAYDAIKKTEVFLKEYIRGLEDMMFITHHKVRQPVANILGLSSLLNNVIDSPNDLSRLINYIERSASALDGFTRELTVFIADLEQKGKDNIETSNLL